LSYPTDCTHAGIHARMHAPTHPSPDPPIHPHISLCFVRWPYKLFITHSVLIFRFCCLQLYLSITYNQVFWLFVIVHVRYLSFLLHIVLSSADYLWSRNSNDFFIPDTLPFVCASSWLLHKMFIVFIWFCSSLHIYVTINLYNQVICILPDYTY